MKIKPQTWAFFSGIFTLAGNLTIKYETPQYTVRFVSTQNSAIDTLLQHDLDH